MIRLYKGHFSKARFSNDRPKAGDLDLLLLLKQSPYFATMYDSCTDKYFTSDSTFSTRSNVVDCSKNNFTPTLSSRKVSIRKTGNCSYVDLITNAILASPDRQLTANEIYECLVCNINLDHSPSSLKNTIRHTLSWYKRFKRVQRGTLQKPAWWTVDLSAEPSKKSNNNNNNFKHQAQRYSDSDSFLPGSVDGGFKPAKNGPRRSVSPSNRSRIRLLSPASFYVKSEAASQNCAVFESEYGYRYGESESIDRSNAYGCYSNESASGTGSSDNSQTSTGFANGGTALDLPDTLRLRDESVSTATAQSPTRKRYHRDTNDYDKRYRSEDFAINNRFKYANSGGGGDHHDSQLRLAPLPADLVSLYLDGSSDFLECDILRVLHYEIALEGNLIWTL